jgi:hypothetical protein
MLQAPRWVAAADKMNAAADKMNDDQVGHQRGQLVD